MVVSRYLMFAPFFPCIQAPVEDVSTDAPVETTPRSVSHVQQGEVMYAVPDKGTISKGH